MRKRFIFDLDGTLVPTQLVYSQAIGEFQLVMLHALGRYAPHIKDIGNQFDAIDAAMVKMENPRTGQPYGFSVDRFSDAMVRCYEKLCTAQDRTSDPAVIAEVQRIAHRVIEPSAYQEVGLVSGATRVLDTLQNRGADLVLLTKHEDATFQQEKIEALGLTRWFPEPRIVSEKTVRTFAELAGPKDAWLNWSIGDSFPSDIEPALQAGLNAIFIPSPDRWTFERQRESELLQQWGQDRLVCIRDIRELLQQKECCRP
ncbi:MAG: hypothetical protein A2682_00510 [Candidatus Terrybacteria bacterium RIFCSPHIGHO2_01_FULL_58_15]|uniref:Haloacid dehalogenase n=1 Tax=Terrybacteria sp. (strain RIFCSPHIGHO2_01_FULL_58_15) TaxID=1802363 RepID=A0A1G2PP06_TERXR|nr:MAG: hypothetical protein A2682_00510 [Candidatus Terrybacteria bacterium RIFCSPHIGHO2_01_FULL_58_15]